MKNRIGKFNITCYYLYSFILLYIYRCVYILVYAYFNVLQFLWLTYRQAAATYTNIPTVCNWCGRGKNHKSPSGRVTIYRQNRYSYYTTEYLFFSRTQRICREATIINFWDFWVGQFLTIKWNSFITDGFSF